MIKIDEDSYNEGRAAFAAGASLRSIAEQCLTMMDKPGAPGPDDIKVFSGALGFADALLDQIRNPLVAVRDMRP